MFPYIGRCSLIKPYLFFFSVQPTQDSANVTTDAFIVSGSYEHPDEKIQPGKPLRLRYIFLCS